MYVIIMRILWDNLHSSEVKGLFMDVRVRRIGLDGLYVNVILKF